MTVLAAAVSESLIALAADGHAAGDAGLPNVDDVIKVMPLFGRFAVGFAGQHMLIAPELEGDSPDVPKMAAKYGFEFQEVVGAFHTTGAVETSVLLRSAALEAASTPRNPVEVCGALWSFIGPGFVATTREYPDGDIELRLFVAGWDPDGGQGVVVRADAATRREPNGELTATLTGQQLGSSTSPGIAYVNQDDEIRPRRYAGLPEALSEPDTAERMIQLAIESDPVSFGGTIGCVAVTSERAWVVSGPPQLEAMRDEPQ